MKPSIEPVAADQLPTACEVLFGWFASDEGESRCRRMLALIESGEFDSTGLLIAKSESTIVGAILSQHDTGNAAAVWPPGTRSHDSITAIEDQLVAAMLKRLQVQGVKTAQCLLPLNERERASALLRGGFRLLTDLVSYFCSISSRNAAAEPATFTLSPTEPDDPAFGEVLMRTYIDTLDAPELNGIRSADEILAGYRATDRDPASRVWFLAERDGVRFGIVLLHSDSAKAIMELNYLGIVPEYRGRGLGRELLRWSLSEARRRQAEWMMLSADARNYPAIGLYTSLGFREIDRQAMYFWINPV